MSFDHGEEQSFYDVGFSCRPSYNTQMKYQCCFDPYEPYNENVFESNEDNVLDDAEYVYDYLNQVLGIEEKNIIIFGRSMGSGPATHISSVRKPGALLLMSSFKSIRSIAEDQAGHVLKYLIQDRFDNFTKIKNVTSPTFLVHGMKDNLIPFHHSKSLHENCGGPCSLIMPSRMDHNDFDFCEDLITPFYHFLRQCKINTREPKSAHKQMIIPSEYFIIPKAYKQKSYGLGWSCYCIQPSLQMRPSYHENNQTDESTIYNETNRSAPIQNVYGQGIGISKVEKSNMNRQMEEKIGNGSQRSSYHYEYYRNR